MTAPMTIRTSSAAVFHNYIAGGWKPALSGATASNINPADSAESLGQFPLSGIEDIDLAISAAADAQPAWAATQPATRAGIVARAATILAGRADDVARDLTREEGKTIGEAKGEVSNSVAKMNYAVGDAPRLAGETVPGGDGIHLYTLREPLGVVAVVTPWNFPLSTPAGKIGAALVAGNTVVLKPATLTPLSALRLIEVFAEAGAPVGVVNLVMGSGGKLGSALVGDRRVKGVSFTGSTGVGVGIAKEAAPNLAKLQLELGGKNVLVVMEDADLEKAAQAIVDGAFLSCGQKCTATSRVIVHRDVKAALTRKILERTAALKVGDGLDTTNHLGPLVDGKQLESVLSYVDIGRKEGARLLVGGEHLSSGAYAKGFYMSPAVFDDVDPEMRIALEEIFGPVLSLLTVSSFDEAVDVANRSDYGLSSAIYTNSIRYAQEFARRIQAGVVKINGPTPGNAPSVPFGGRKLSGLGIMQKQIDFFTELKSVYQRFN